jgi:hypothetical protein
VEHDTDGLEYNENSDVQPMAYRTSALEEDVQIQIEDLNDDEDDEKDKNASNGRPNLKKTKFEIYWKRYNSFTQSPKGKMMNFEIK